MDADLKTVPLPEDVNEAAKQNRHSEEPLGLNVVEKEFKGTGVKDLLEFRKEVPYCQINRGGHRHLKMTEEQKGLKGLWWVYRPTKETQNKRMKALSTPVRKVGKKLEAEGPQTTLDWVIHNAKQLPGPGQYNPKTDPRQRYFGSFNQSKAKTMVEWEIYRAKQLPGPGRYTLGAEYKIPGGKFNDSKGKNCIEWVQYYAKSIPGPADYDTRKYIQHPGGRFNFSNPKSEIEWLQMEAKHKPGPGQYNPAPNPDTPGGRFNNSQSKNYVEWQIYRAKQLPGPGDYHLPTLAEEFSRSKRGRFNMSNAKSEIEWMVYEAAGKPSPGSYDPKMDGAFKTLDELNMEEEKKRSGISPGKSKKQKSKKAASAC